MLHAFSVCLLHSHLIHFDFFNLILFRHVLAILHFNYNLERDVRYKPDGTEQLRISYPKFKNGAATVRNIAVRQNFGKDNSDFSLFQRNQILRKILIY